MRFVNIVNKTISTEQNFSDEITEVVSRRFRVSRSRPLTCLIIYIVKIVYPP